MSVSDGQRVNAAVTNAAFMSRTADDNTVGIKSLENTDPESGVSIDNIQKEHNSIASFVGKSPNTDPDVVPTWLSDDIGATGDPVKNRVDAVQAVVESHTVSISDNAADISDLRTLSGTLDGETNLGTFTGSTISDDVDIKVALQELETAVEDRIESSEKGAPDGVATLDGSGKIPSSQLSLSVMEFKGNWDASTNTPTLVNGTGDTGDVYKVSVAGSVDFGAGSISFNVGDWVYYDGAIWTKDADQVNSVNGQDGDVVLDSDDISEGATNLYFTNARADARIAAASIDDLSDVDTSTTPPVLNDVLTWTGSQWEPAESTGGGGSGTGSKNYVDQDSSRFEVDIGSWFTFDDGSSYVDGTGGTSANLTITRTAVVGEVLEGNGSLSIVKDAADAEFEGLSLDLVTIDRADLGRTLYGSIEVDASDANFASGDLKLFAFDVTNSVILPLINDDDGEIPSGKGKVLFRVLPSSTTEEIRLSLMVNSTNATAYEVFIDDVRLGPAAQIEAQVLGETRASRTTNQSIPNITDTTVIFDSVTFDQLGLYNSATGIFTANRTMKVRVSAFVMFAATTAWATTERGELKLYKNGSQFSLMSRRTQFDSSNTFLDVNGSDTVSLVAGDTLEIRVRQDTGGSLDTFANFCNVSFSVIGESAILSTTEAANQTIKFTASGTSQSINDNVSSIINYPSNQYGNTENWVAAAGSYNAATGQWATTNPGFRVPQSGWYLAVAGVNFANSAATDYEISISGSSIANVSRQNVTRTQANNTGMEITHIFPANAGDIIRVTARWRNGSGSTTTSATGSRNSFSIMSIPDFTTFGVSGSFEVLGAQSSSFALSTAGYASTEWAEMVGNELTLTPGVWVLDGNIRYNPSGSTSTYIEGAWFLANGNNTTTPPTALTSILLDGGSYQAFGRSVVNDTGSFLIAAPPIPVQITTTTTVYFVGRATFATAGSAAMIATLMARRIR